MHTMVWDWWDGKTRRREQLLSHRMPLLLLVWWRARCVPVTRTQPHVVASPYVAPAWCPIRVLQLISWQETGHCKDNARDRRLLSVAETDLLCR